MIWSHPHSRRRARKEVKTRKYEEKILERKTACESLPGRSSLMSPVGGRWRRPRVGLCPVCSQVTICPSCPMCRVETQTGRTLLIDTALSFNPPLSVFAVYTWRLPPRGQTHPLTCCIKPASRSTCQPTFLIRHCQVKYSLPLWASPAALECRPAFIF